jgi:hypothetical protein
MATSGPGAAAQPYLPMESAVSLGHEGAMPIAVHAVSSYARYFADRYLAVCKP